MQPTLWSEPETIEVEFPAIWTYRSPILPLPAEAIAFMPMGLCDGCSDPIETGDTVRFVPGARCTHSECWEN